MESFEFDGFSVSSEALTSEQCAIEAVRGRLNEICGWPESDLDLGLVRSRSLAYLNTWRGDCRLAAGLTSAAFQELCYTGKALECQRWIVDQESAFGLTMEAAARGISNLAMAQLVLSQWSAWMAASDVIEADYVDARAVIEAAVSVEEIEAVLAGLG